MSRLPRQNNKAELDAFEQVCLRLHGFAGHVNFEYVDGYLTALATLPTWPPAEGWLEDMADDAFERAFADPQDREHGLRMLKLRLSVLRDQLDVDALTDNPGDLRLYPLLAEPLPAEAGHPATALAMGWAMGCLVGLEYVEKQIAMPTEGELRDEYDKLLAAVDAMTVQEDPPDNGRREAMLTEAMFAMQVIRLWALDTVPPIEQRRVEKAPGRNDACPCGSGKKYKKCHGA
jgi:uncharacterized protein